jgi:hypothetical protein
VEFRKDILCVVFQASGQEAVPPPTAIVIELADDVCCDATARLDRERGNIDGAACSGANFCEHCLIATAPVKQRIASAICPSNPGLVSGGWAKFINRWQQTAWVDRPAPKDGVPVADRYRQQKIDEGQFADKAMGGCFIDVVVCAAVELSYLFGNAVKDVRR